MKRLIWLYVVAALPLLAVQAVGGQAVAQQPAPEATGKFLRLEDLEQMALRGNPTVGQAAALVQSVLGRRVQAGLYPNPIVGYKADDITASEPNRGKHFFFVQQSIITGRKREYVRNAVDQEVVHAEAEREIQTQRVLNAVRLIFYEALGAERLVQVRRELARLAREAVDVSEQLYNLGQADRPDVLAVEMEAERAQLDLERAEHDLDRVWHVLAAVVGDAALARRPLAGDLEAEIPVIDETAVRDQILRASPELKIARARVEHARWSLARARSDRVPNVFVRGGLGYNFERAAPREDVGVEALFEIGMPLPLFDRNQGNIASAEAQLALAQGELRRTELALQERLAGAIKEYRDARRTVERYPREVLGRAQRAYELYLERFRQMAASYPQVLIAQRALGQARAEYVRALVDVWQSAVTLQGQLLAGGLAQPEAVPGEPPVAVEAVPFTVTP